MRFSTEFSKGAHTIVQVPSTPVPLVLHPTRPDLGVNGKLLLEFAQQRVQGISWNCAGQ